MRREKQWTWFDTAFHWVTPSLIGVLVALLVLIFSGYSANAEEWPIQYRPHIVHVKLTGDTLYCLAEVPEDTQYYAAVTYFLDGSDYIMIVQPIDENGEARLIFGAAVSAVEITLTDTEDVFTPGTYTEYDSLWIQM